MAKDRLLLLLSFYQPSPYLLLPSVPLTIPLLCLRFHWSNCEIVSRWLSTYLSPLPPHSSRRWVNRQNVILSFVSYKEERNCSHFTRRIDCLYGAGLPRGGPCLCVCVCVCVCVRACVRACTGVCGLEVAMVTCNHFPTALCAQHQGQNNWLFLKFISERWYMQGHQKSH